MEIQNLDKYIKNKFPENLATSTSLDDLQAQTIRILHADFEKFVSWIKANETRAIASVNYKTREMSDIFQGCGGYLTLYVRILSQYQRLKDLTTKGGKKSQEALAKLLQSVQFNSKVLHQRAEISFQEVKELLKAEEERVDKESETEISFYFGGPGIYLNGCLLSQIKNDSTGFSSNLRKLLKYKTLISEHSGEYFEELLYGASGYIYCLLTLQTQCEGLLKGSDTNAKIQQDIIEIATQIIDAGIKNYNPEGPEVDLENLPKDFRLVYKFYGQEYFGAAHGLFGILYTLLRAYQINTEAFTKENPALGKKLLTTVRASLKYVLRFQTGSGNFPSSAMGKDSLVQFCHGAPGAVACFLTAAEVFKDQHVKEKYYEAALLAGEAIWNFGILRKGYGLCHGICGNGYAFLTLFQNTFDKKWLYRALCFVSTKEDSYFTDEIANYHVDDRYTKGKSDFPFSLMLGLAGDICMEIDCLLPDTARFPGYEV